MRRIMDELLVVQVIVSIAVITNIGLFLVTNRIAINVPLLSATNFSSSQRNDSGYDSIIHPDPDKGEVIVITNGTVETHWVIVKEDALKPCRDLEPWMRCQYVLSNDNKVLSQADAVVVRADEVREGFTIPDDRPHNQKWIFYATESPFKTWNRVRLQMDNIWDKFNMSVTYNPEADIYYTPYGIDCKYNPNAEAQVTDYAKDKTGGVLWMVSNCHKTMGRELYVDELREHIDVDIYGSCGGKVICGDYSNLNFTCVTDFINKYKFYLSFENSFCKDYYTEKVGKTLHTNTIPIVMGHVNYSEFLTPGTFIDVRDFPSPKHLAKYLDYLSNNDTAYNEYIYRKRQLSCSKREPRKVACALCKYLHLNRQRTQILPDMKEHWGMESQCLNVQQYFTGIADKLAKNNTN